MKEKIKTFFNRYKIIVIISTVLLILFILNLLFAILGNDTPMTTKSFVFTVISAWLSCIATLIIGIIAYRQSEKYKKENDIYLQKLNEEKYREELAKQFDLYRSRLSSCFDELRDNNYSNYLENLMRIFEKDNGSIYNIVLIEKTIVSQTNYQFVFFLNEYYFDTKKVLYENLEKYYQKLRILLKDYESIILNQDIDLIKEIQNIYQECCILFQKHISEIGLFTTKIIKQQDIKKLEVGLKEKKEAQAQWWKNIKSTKEQKNDGKTNDDV